jgi:formate dehydrogenase major subunit
MTNDIAGIKKADVILIIGSDTSAAHPVIAARIKQAVREGKSKLIVIDPKRIVMADYAEIYAAQRPGSDVAVMNCMMQEILRNGWEDKEYVANRLEGFDEFKAEIMKEKYSPENVEILSGIKADTLRAIAKLFGQAKTASLFYAMGITQHTTGRDNVWTTANLQMLCGNVGVEGGGVNPLRGQSNVQGACDMGGLPNVYPGYQAVSVPANQEKFEKAWNCKLDNKVGITVTEMIDAAYDGTLRALYVMGENPFLSDPDQTHVIAAMEKIDFLVVQDMFITETAEFADVILPAAAFAEKEGHFTNTERRIQRINKIIEPPQGVKNDWEIVQMIANAMGADWNYESARDISKEINLLTPQYAGITWERVGRFGLQWPCPNEEHPGTPYLHKDKFARGKGLLSPIPFKEPDELPDEDYPLILTTGRVLQQFHTGTMSRKTQGLNNIAGPMVMISVEDAENLKIANSEIVKISTRRGEITAPAFVTKRIQKGVIYIPFHYKESPANRLTNPAIDPIAKIPEYKVCAAKVQKTT